MRLFKCIYLFNNGAKCHQYADVIQFYMHFTLGPNIFGDLDRCSDSVAHSFLLNGLMVNPSKTETILFGMASHIKATILNTCELKFVVVKVPIVKSVCILVVTLDSSVSLDTCTGS